MTDADADLSDLFVSTFYGNTSGWACFGYKPSEQADGQNERIVQQWFHWPDQQDKAIEWIEDRAPRHALYWSPLLFRSESRSKGNAVSRRWLKLDLDGPPADAELLAKLHAIEVLSGRPGNSHQYVALTRSLPDRSYHALARALRDRIGGAADAKIADNDLMRLPGSLNFRTTPPSLVASQPGPRSVWDPDELRALIGPLASIDDAEGDDTGERVQDAERVSWRRLPNRVQAVLRQYADMVEGEGRFRATFRIVKVCKESGVLTLDQTLGVIEEHHSPSVEKFGRRLAGQVEKCWNMDSSAMKAPVADDEEEEEPDEPVLVSFSDIVERKVEWIWYAWLPAGKIVTMDGDPGVSKSTLALTIAAHITRGRDWPDGSQCPEGEVIIMSAEDDADDTIKPRLRLAGAKMDRVHLFTEIRVGKGSRLPTLADSQALRDIVERVGAKLVVVDVLMAYVPGDKSANGDAEVRSFLHPLKTIATETGCAFLLLRHLNKDKGTNAKYRGGGSIGITGQSRAVWTVGEDQNREGIRILSSAKVNNAPRPTSLEYELDFDAESETARIRWLGESDMTADDLVTDHKAQTAAPRRSEAETTLRAVLTSAGGSMPSAELAEAMEAAGFSKATAHRAGVNVGVQKAKDKSMSGGWTTSLPNIST